MRMLVGITNGVNCHANQGALEMETCSLFENSIAFDPVYKLNHDVLAAAVACYRDTVTYFDAIRVLIGTSTFLQICHECSHPALVSAQRALAVGTDP